MKLAELYAARPERSRRQSPISWAVLGEHFDAIKKAYTQAGLDPATPSSERVCPGLTLPEGTFQIDLKQDPNGQILGSHSLAASQEEDHVNETDIFMWDGSFDLSSGRLREPSSQFLQDYNLGEADIRQLTTFTIQSVASGLFVAVQSKQILSVPQ